MAAPAPLFVTTTHYCGGKCAYDPTKPLLSHAIVCAATKNTTNCTNPRRYGPTQWRENFVSGTWDIATKTWLEDKTEKIPIAWGFRDDGPDVVCPHMDRQLPQWNPPERQALVDAIFKRRDYGKDSAASRN
jgi:hypothetical protein